LSTQKPDAGVLLQLLFKYSQSPFDFRS
jgi:hypothetical protein